MNCRQIERILPEMVSGEIDEKTAALAHAHMALCPACASEYAGYQAALCALAQPRESVECPTALDVLRLPEPRRGWSWARPVFATAALAAVLAGIMLMPRTHESTQPQLASKVSEHRTVLPEAGPPPEPTTAPEPKKPTESSRPRVRHNMVALADIRTPGRPAPPPALGLAYDNDSSGSEAMAMKAMAPASAPIPGRASGTWAFDSAGGKETKPEGSVIVLACDIDDSPQPDVPVPTEISITSTDRSTGATAVYEYTRDSEGSEEIIETTSSRPMGS